MSTFLFAWNPKKWDWKERDLTKKILKVAATGSAEDSWSCGNRKELPLGSRFFLIRLGKDPKGIVGSGLTITDPELGPHWNSALKRQGKVALFVDLKFDFLSNEPLIAWASFRILPFRISRGAFKRQASYFPIPSRRNLSSCGLVGLVEMTRSCLRNCYRTKPLRKGRREPLC